MTSENERVFLKFYSEKYYSGEGKIVDLGCWLGATSFAIANGLNNNRSCENFEKVIYAFDLFEWNDSLEKHVRGTSLEGKLIAGDCYRHIFEENLRSYSSVIETCGDIRKNLWHFGKIEFLLIDAMKTPVLAKEIVSKFYPFLIAKKSVIYHQDFDHYLTPWVHILIYLHKSYCKHIHDIPGRGGTVFRVIKPFPDSLINLDPMSLDDKTVDFAFKYCLSIASESKHNGIAAAHAMYYIYKKKPEEAFITWTGYLWKGYELSQDFIEVKKLIDKF